MEKEAINKYLFWAALAILIILSYLIINPFLISLISAFILAYLTKPVFDYLSPKINKKLSAIVCLLLIIIIILLPIGTIIGGTIAQAKNSLDADIIKSFLKDLSSYPLLQKLNLNPQELTKTGIEITISLLKISASALPSIILSIIITLIAIYYILTNWDILAEKLKNYLPFKDKQKAIKEISQITNALVYGTVLIGLIEFVIAALGFYILGINSYLFLATIIFFFAFIPALGPAVVWIPLAIYYFVIQSYPLAIGVIIIGIILSIGIDGLLKIKLLGKKAEINPLIMLIGILGGIPLFGVFGFIIGPLILIYTIELIEDLLTKT